ncbi:MAG TPA: serine hydrolase domain-containing protein [Kofleriaceae bacterium]|jgi:CubicO group peptidase (beta-lactamase class C family)
MRRTAVAVSIALTTCLLSCARKPKAPPPPPDPKDLPANIDKIANDVLAETGVPSASVAAVSDGKVVYVHAYGNARLQPMTPAAPAMRYSIGSISKQFTSVALLMLAQDGKLSIDDPVGKYVPGLTRGDAITIRQILSHTSGYPDYAPQDYMIPEWEKPVSAEALLDRWARKDLEFEPGTRWQYSNTNFVIAGLIVEKVAGVQLVDFLGERVFKPLGMTSVTNTDRQKLGDQDAQGYFRRALGPLHPAPHEGPGWMYAAGELAMTAEDLAKWDAAVIQKAILAPESYRQLESEVVLASGAGTRYGLGITVQLTQGHRELRHGGEVSGFVAANIVWPDDKLAVAVLTNQDASDAAATIAEKVRDALFRATSPASIESDQRVKQTLLDLADKKLDRSRLTANLSAYFTDEAIAEYADTLRPLGTLDSIAQVSTARRGGMIYRHYKAKYGDKTMDLSVYETTDGKLEQFLLSKD